MTGFFDWFWGLFGGKSEKPRRVLVISDIHGNAHALDAVLKEAEKEDVTDVYCLGDLVGVGVLPNETIGMLRRLENKVRSKGGEFVLLAGNGEFYYMTDAGREYLEKQKHKVPGYSAITKWSHDVMTPENKSWVKGHVKLRNKDEIIKAVYLMNDPKKDLVYDPASKQYHAKWTMKHMTSGDKKLLEEMGFRKDPEGAVEKLTATLGSEPMRFDAEVDIDGKITHLSHGGPGPLFERRTSGKDQPATRGKTFTAEQAFQLLSDEVQELIRAHEHLAKEEKTKSGKRMISVGSVGQPRTGVPKAHYAMIYGRDEKGELKFEHKTTEYDVEGAVRYVQAFPHLHAKHKQRIAEALRKGTNVEEIAEKPASWLERLFGVG